jgi:16S rRNA (uracil1498-N3)-methyltransferase
VTAPVFIVGPEQPLAVGRIVLSGAEGRHAVSVRRLRAGEDIVLTDGAGTGAYGRVAAAEGKDHLEVDVTEVRAEPEPRPRITVVQALPKGDRGELAVETMTETGVDAIVPWAAARCVTQWRAEAAKQSRRLRFPDVAELMTTRQVTGLLARAAFAAVLHEEGSEPLAAAALPDDGDIVLVVGPEGGVAPDELDAFAAAGAKPYRLGPTVLRTSTAGVAATALLLGRTGRWG